MALKIRPARHYQRRDDAVRAIADHGQRVVRKPLKEAMRHLSDLVDEERIVHLIKIGFVSRVADSIDWPHYREVLKAPFDKIALVREAASALGVRKINGSFHAKQRAVRFKKMGLTLEPQVLGGTLTREDEQLQNLFDISAVHKDIGGRFNFDRFDQATQEKLRLAQDELIKELEQTARDNIDAIVLAGVQSGASVEEIASDIREMISLTANQSQAVINYRNMLENLDSGALQRQLRNDVFDTEVQDAIESGEQLAQDRVDQMVNDYIENYLDYRAATIAQTESTRASNEGLQDAYQQAIDRGALPAEAVTQQWVVALDERTCEVCLSIPDMNPDGVAIGESFDSIDGPMDSPPDPHPACRCSLDIITNLDLVPDEEA